MTSYQHAIVDGSRIFYREAGSKTAPTILLLHGFPTSSHMFRDLIPALADRYHVVAPDLPDSASRMHLTANGSATRLSTWPRLIDSFTQTIGLERYAIYVFDYGAPVGLRLALAHPERITAIISQNGNAYEEGLSQGWNPIQKYWKEPTAENRAALREFLKPEATKSQYLYGVQDQTLVAPEAYELDSALLARPGNDEIQLDLFLDYASNVALYPKFQEYFRTQRPPLLAVWARVIRSSCLLVRKRSNVTTRAPRCVSTTPATSRSKRTIRKSLAPFEISLVASWQRRSKPHSQMQLKDHPWVVVLLLHHYPPRAFICRELGSNLRIAGRLLLASVLVDD